MKKILKNKEDLLGFIVIMGLLALGLILWGWSYYKSIAPINIGHPQKGDFVKVGKMSEPRYNHEAILLDDGTVLVFGGQTLRHNYEGGSDTADIYNPETKKFTDIGHMLRRGYKVPINLHNGKILMIGGSGGYSQKGTQFYNTSTRGFEIGPDLNYPRSDATATQLMDGRILVAGGQGGFKKSELYNPKTGEFEITAKMNIPRFDHSAILLKDGRVLIVGGVGKRGFLSDAEIYNPKTNKFELIGNMNVAKVEPNLYLLKNENVLIVNVFHKEIEIFSPKTNKFELIAERTSKPEMPAEVLLSDDTLLFTGGQTGVGLSLCWYKTSEIFDPKTGKFIQGKDMNFLRSGHRATLLKDGNVLITGSDGKGRTAELYISK